MKYIYTHHFFGIPAQNYTALKFATAHAGLWCELEGSLKFGSSWAYASHEKQRIVCCITPLVEGYQPDFFQEVEPASVPEWKTLNPHKIHEN